MVCVLSRLLLSRPQEHVSVIGGRKEVESFRSWSTGLLIRNQSIVVFV